MSEYEQVVEAILAIPKFTKEKHDFSILRTYLAALGNPEQGRRVIHVAGTNGKGSVCRMISGILQKAGRKVGEFYSPHLVRMNERLRVNGREIRDRQLVLGYKETERIRKERNLPQLTFFELLFVIALWFFREEEAEDIVLETGLGGRLDATSSIPADLFVITQIGMDHEEYLGDTIEKIAGEKAGIITSDAPVVYHTGREEADRVIRARAEVYGCSAVVNAGEAKLREQENTPLGIDFSFQNDYDMYDHVFLPTGALYQVDNAMTAITAAAFLLPELPKEDMKRLVKEALAGFAWEGRLESVRPGVYLDGAHNPSAARVLAGSIQRLYAMGDWKESQLVFGASGDKNIREVLKELCTFPWDRIILTRYQGTRSASVEELRRLIREICPKIGADEKRLVLADTPEDVLQYINIPGPEEQDGGDIFTVITGSLYLVGEFKRIYQDDQF